MKTILLSLLLVPALALAADEAKPKKPGKGAGGAQANPEKAHKRLDTNSDGTVSLEEFKAGPRGKKDPTKAEKAFQKLDKDSDGKMTLEEFKAGRPAPKPDAPKPDAPKPDAPKPDAPKPA
jgi:hypothetical protein